MHALLARSHAHHRKHVRWLDPAGGELGLVARMNSVDERSIPIGLRVEVEAKRPVDERIDDVGEPDEKVEVESPDELGQDVLGANALESRDRAVPVVEPVLLPLKLTVVAIAVWQLGPEFVDELTRLGPAQMPVATNDVRHDESPVSRQGGAYPVEDVFERHDMMQRLAGDHHIVATLRPPLIQVDLDRNDVRSDTGPTGFRCAPREHRGVDIEAVDGEVAAPVGQQAAASLISVSQLPAPTLRNRRLRPRTFS